METIGIAKARNSGCKGPAERNQDPRCNARGPLPLGTK